MNFKPDRPQSSRAFYLPKNKDYDRTILPRDEGAAIK